MTIKYNIAMTELEYYKDLVERQIAFTGKKMEEIEALKKELNAKEKALKELKIYRSLILYSL